MKEDQECLLPSSPHFCVLLPGNFSAMKFGAFLSVFVFSISAAAIPGAMKAGTISGIDVSSTQGRNINWSKVKSNGIHFAFVKATEGTSYVNPDFSSQYSGATKVGLIRGSYHFAHPGSSSGSAQATYFIKHGGGWSKDGITLPGALDFEAGCNGLSHSAMVAWIKSFSDRYHSSEGRYPILYIRTNWWKSCTGNSASFGSKNPLWLASWASSMGPLPAGWKSATFWQYTNHSSSNPGDQNEFHGDLKALRKLALGP
ncbi:glycoside hydrolase family 25 protein [Hygrophoropsis aurantiaca]|uniref:Glycoside hydrolase family 25 protein n=1 Tax=Hygrophoropsis aurantiaca TaxID=72124 RepID=A0ACB7ZNQ9_9AGAM|nr:glycoside hydrolase family 25 protein [Hygrophoropsis aurantiaca]